MSDVILHPIFERCKKFTLDRFWQDIFDGCAKNRFPQRVKYDPSKKMLYLKGDKKKKFSLDFDDERKLFLYLIKIFREELSIYSDLDVSKNSKKNVQIYEEEEWTKIKPKWMKENMIIDYLSGYQKKFSIPDKILKKLFYSLQIAFQFRLVNKVICSDGKIEKIEGLTFDPKENIFLFSASKKKLAPSKNNSNQPSNRFFSCVKKYLS